MLGAPFGRAIGANAAFPALLVRSLGARGSAAASAAEGSCADRGASLRRAAEEPGAAGPPALPRPRVSLPGLLLHPTRTESFVPWFSII